jgi:hypothetical protein
MPAVKRRRTTSHAKARRSRTRARKSSAPRGLSRITKAPFPNSKVATLRYVDQAQLSPPADGMTINKKSWRSNSIFDPQFSLGGHQPYGHDQFALLYHHYEVLEAKIRVTFTCADTDRDGVSSQIVGIRSGGDMGVSAPIDENTMCEAPNVRFGIIPPGVGKLVLNHTFSQKEFYSPKHSGLTAAFGTNPAEQAFFEIWSGSQVGNGNAAVAALIEIEYKCRFFEPKDLNQS